MQDILSELFWRSEVINEQAAKLCETLPGFPEAREQYLDVSEHVRSILGPELFDRFYNQFMRYTDYEVRAYYAFGLGLREELVRALFTPQSSSPSPAWS